ncbi:hypothetical protein pb186bvf_020649 [Paramecium bursaria]
MKINLFLYYFKLIPSQTYKLKQFLSYNQRECKKGFNGQILIILYVQNRYFFQPSQVSHDQLQIIQAHTLLSLSLLFVFQIHSFPYNIQQQQSLDIQYQSYRGPNLDAQLRLSQSHSINCLGSQVQQSVAVSQQHKKQEENSKLKN